MIEVMFLNKPSTSRLELEACQIAIKVVDPRKIDLRQK